MIPGIIISQIFMEILQICSHYQSLISLPTIETPVNLLCLLKCWINIENIWILKNSKYDSLLISLKQNKKTRIT